jgi:hypothetical protein
MNLSVMLPPQREVMQREVATWLQQRWIKPAPSVVGPRPPKNHVDNLSRTVLDTMLTRQFRNAKFPDQDAYAQQLKCVRYWVRRGRPIRLNLGYAPMKNLNAAHASRADWAEFFALCHLCAWHNKVQAVYPPGLQIKIVFDDSAVALANRPDPALMDSYIKSIDELISALRYRSFIRGVGRHSSFAWLFHILPLPLSRLHLWWWERQQANQPVIERMDLYAKRNLTLPPGLSAAEEEQLCKKASHRYRAYWGALLVALWFQKMAFCANSLIAMYLDGSQHHIPLKKALHLTTVGKGQITQPWQGEGALCDNGHGELIPIVLTSKRRAEMNVMEVTDLNLIPMEGFDHIQVCAPTGQPAAE